MGIENKIRKYKRILLVPAALALFGLEGCRAVTQEDILKHKAEYGTLENPNYTRVEGNKTCFREYWDELLEERLGIKNFDEFDNKLENLAKKLKEYTERIQTIDGNDKAEVLKFKTEVSRNMMDMLELKIKGGEEQVDVWKKSLDYFFKIVHKKEGYDNKRIVELGNTIFKRLTGKNVPKEVNVSFVNSLGDEGIAGETGSIDNKIAIVGIFFEHDLLTYEHELGHLVYQGAEAYAFQGLIADRWVMGWPSNKIRIGSMEEAAASLFELGCLEEARKMGLKEYRDIRDVILTRRLGYLHKYFKGSEEKHVRGWVLAEVLLDYCEGDSGKAFNLLCKVNKINELPKEVVLNYENFREKAKYRIADPIDLRFRMSEELLSAYRSLLNDKIFSDVRIWPG